ncbi:hypothetical protein JCM10212_002181 [Sporobolomyces blumeae]
MIPPLPYEIMLLIFDYLGRSPEDPRYRLFDHSTLAEQRQIGSVISLVSRKFASIGQDIVWRNVSFGESKVRVSRAKIEILSREPRLAQKVRRLDVSAQDAGHLSFAGLPSETLLLQFPYLTSLEVTAIPEFVLRLLNPSSLAALPRLKHFYLYGYPERCLPHASPREYFELFLRVLPHRLAGLKSLRVTLANPMPYLYDSPGSEIASDSRLLAAVQAADSAFLNSEGSISAEPSVGSSLGHID